MNPVLVWRMLRKDLALGPRSPIFLWAVAMPFALTLILQVAFGSLFDPEPRLGIVDQGDSEITAELTAMEGITVTVLDDPAALRTQVEANDLDAGIVLPTGFDDAVRAGRSPTSSSGSAVRAWPPTASSSPSPPSTWSGNSRVVVRRWRSRWSASGPRGCPSRPGSSP